MANQEQKKPTQSREDANEWEVAPEDLPQQDPDAKQALDDETDGVLDEIDEVLEANAEEFVRGFVQKGGQ